jgi:hypothetical protein
LVGGSALTIAGRSFAVSSRMIPSLQFGANHIGRKSGPQQATVEGRNLSLIERPPNARKLSFEPPSQERRLVGLGENRFESGRDVPVRYAARAELSRDAKSSLSPGFGVPARVTERELRVIQVTLLAQKGDDGRDGILVPGLPGQVFLHLVDGIRAAHERPQSGAIKLLFAGGFSRRISHPRI